MSDAPDGLVRLNNGRIRICIQPGLGAGLTEMAVKLKGRWEDVLRPCIGPADDPEELACCLLMPWSNRLYGGGFRWRERRVPISPLRPVDPVPLHGDAWLARWQLERQGADDVTLVHDARDGEHFQYVGHVRYALKGSTLCVEMRVRHHGVAPMPYGLGLHPWFLRPPDTRIRFHSGGRWEPDATRPPRQLRLLSGDERPSFKLPKGLPDELIDHAYVDWDGKAEIHWPSRGLDVHMRADRAAQFLVVYAPAPAACADFVCLEPVTHAPDAHRAHAPLSLGLIELHNGDCMSLAVTLTATSA